jgi:cytochrome c oxidase subunit 4
MSNDMKHHVKVYRNVFIGLLIFTALTVGASYVEFNYIWLGVTVGLAIAFVKGYLVAANFMHLNNEKSIIYLILSLTVVFFIVLFSMPMLWHNDLIKSPDYIPIQNGEVLKKHDHNNHGEH